MTELYYTFIANAVSLAGFLLAFSIYRTKTRNSRETKIADEAVFKSDMSQLKIDFKKETGGNSGGLREAVNLIRATQLKLDGQLESIATSTHRLEGSFEEHRILHERMQ